MKTRILTLIAILFATCTSVFAQTQMVTFQVQSPDSTPVYVFGSWSGWGNFPGTLMTSLGGGTYSTTMPIASNTTHEFLFVNGATPVTEVLNPAWTCTNANAQYTNRVLNLGSADTGVCYTFATCNACTITPPPPPPAPINVTFQVESPDSLPVSLIGSWNWASFPGASMTQVSPTKYSVTVPLQGATTYEYLFVNGAIAPIKEVLDPAWACTNANPQYTNRVLNLGTTDTAICVTWETCNTCTVVTPPASLNITFQVENPDSTPVYVFGSWSNWSNWPGTPMVLNTTSGLYEATLAINGGSSIEYLYVNGVGPTKEVLDPMWACTNGDPTYTNRKVTLGTVDSTLCSQWETCNACGSAPAPVNELNSSNIDLLVGSDFVKINSTSIKDFDQIEIYDIVGKLIFAKNQDVVANKNIPVQLQRNTIYLFRIKSGNELYKVKGMIK